MVKMKFDWENETKKIAGSFTVTSFSVEECMVIAKEEIKESEGYEMVDWYEI